MRTGRYAPRCLATRVAWPPVLVDDTIALKGGVDARYHSYLRRTSVGSAAWTRSAAGFLAALQSDLMPPARTLVLLGYSSSGPSSSCP